MKCNEIACSVSLSLTKLRGWLVIFAHKMTDGTAEVLSEDPERVPDVS